MIFSLQLKIAPGWYNIISCWSMYRFSKLSFALVQISTLNIKFDRLETSWTKWMLLGLEFCSWLFGTERNKMVIVSAFKSIRCYLFLLKHSTKFEKITPEVFAYWLFSPFKILFFNLKWTPTGFRRKGIVHFEVLKIQFVTKNSA